MLPAFNLKALVINLHPAFSVPREEMRELLSTTCCVNTSVIGDIRRQPFSRTHELCHY